MSAPTPEQQVDFSYEEGDACPEIGCDGKLRPSKVTGCSCHINPPCSACTNAGFECPECYWDSDPKEEPDITTSAPAARIDRSSQITGTGVSGHFNSTPFTKCCGTAAIGLSRCPSCNAEIISHDDGLAQRRRDVGPGNCLMCARPRGDISIPGNCCC